MTISVIMPVYDAGSYLKAAVESALGQPEVSEILLVEDNSRDNTLAICAQLARRESRIQLLQHPGEENRGAAASRNLGIAKSKREYIAFLDADDFYLPNRFGKSLDILVNDESVDGVYEAAGVTFENEGYRDVWTKKGLSDLYTFEKVVDPDWLVDAMMNGEGVFQTNSILVRRSIFEKCGLFDEELRLFQDVIMWHKMAAVARLVPGAIHVPVSMHRIHGGNRAGVKYSEEHMRAYMLAWKRMWQWCSNRPLNPRHRRLFLERFLLCEVREMRDNPGGYRHVRSVLHYLRLLATERRALNLSPGEAIWGLFLLSGARGVWRRTGMPRLLPRQDERGNVGESTG